MPRRKPRPDELTTEEAMKKMFPKDVREEAERQARNARKIKPKPTTSKKSS